MTKQKSARKEHIEYHKDGSIRAKGQMDGDSLEGYWEWFRKDGTKLRSGHFENNEQVGEWTTYDQEGKVYKVTRMGSKKGEGPMKKPPPAKHEQKTAK